MSLTASFICDSASLATLIRYFPDQAAKMLIKDAALLWPCCQQLMLAHKIALRNAFIEHSSAPAAAINLLQGQQVCSRSTQSDYAVLCLCCYSSVSSSGLPPGTRTAMLSPFSRMASMCVTGEPLGPMLAHLQVLNRMSKSLQAVSIGISPAAAIAPFLASAFHPAQ